MLSWADLSQILQRQAVNSSGIASQARGRMVTGLILDGIVQSINQDNPVVAHHSLHQPQAADTGLTHLDGDIRRQSSVDGLGHAHAHPIISQNGITQSQDQYFHNLFVTRQTIPPPLFEEGRGPIVILS